MSQLDLHNHQLNCGVCSFIPLSLRDTNNHKEINFINFTKISFHENYWKTTIIYILYTSILFCEIHEILELTKSYFQKISHKH